MPLENIAYAFFTAENPENPTPNNRNLLLESLGVPRYATVILHGQHGQLLSGVEDTMGILRNLLANDPEALFLVALHEQIGEGGWECLLYKIYKEVANGLQPENDRAAQRVQQFLLNLKRVLEIIKFKRETRELVQKVLSASAAELQIEQEKTGDEALYKRLEKEKENLLPEDILILTHARIMPVLLCDDEYVNMTGHCFRRMRVINGVFSPTYLLTNGTYAEQAQRQLALRPTDQPNIS